LSIYWKKNWIFTGKELRKRLNQVKQALIDDAKAKLNSEEERGIQRALS